MPEGMLLVKECHPGDEAKQAHLELGHVEQLCCGLTPPVPVWLWLFELLPVMAVVTSVKTFCLVYKHKFCKS